MENGNETPVKMKPGQSSNRSSPNPRKPNGLRSRVSRQHETEEEAIIRRFHDAQRMARFRAKKKKALEDQQQQQLLGNESSKRQLEKRETASELAKPSQASGAEWSGLAEASAARSESGSPAESESSKYTQLLAVIERLGRDVRLSYAGSRSSTERLKSGIARARSLVRDCLIETKLNLR